MSTWLTNNERHMRLVLRLIRQKLRIYYYWGHFFFSDRSWNEGFQMCLAILVSWPFIELLLKIQRIFQTQFGFLLSQIKFHFLHPESFWKQKRKTFPLLSFRRIWKVSSLVFPPSEITLMLLFFYGVILRSKVLVCLNHLNWNTPWNFTNR